jgi:hypothetical protein
MKSLTSSVHCQKSEEAIKFIQNSINTKIYDPVNPIITVGGAVR